MIPRANRLRDSSEFRQIARFGKKHKSPSVVIAALRAKTDNDRFGFVVPKRVGNAVQRNLYKRRLRAICFELLSNPQGLDVVLRAEPGISQIGYEQLRDEVERAVISIREKLQ